ncbi:DUF1471 family periplasmic protein YahO [Yersinia aleksiciae]|nr:DUF1471 family periplasmic protein YahO [Yersinia aleksiciae]MDA5498326.1 DUF1471 family periplasmic protein YahO [Yersinia aleksiciae]NIK99189.1 DUF1471 domain-containing protein [Yersinia aleksiciae]WQC72849.1 DUF1471 family periplasmic protein YahO [Yersinia aleksiciae]
MKKVILGLFAGALTFSTVAAELMPKLDFEKVKDNYVKVGSITTSGEISQSDAKAELSKKADEKGGDIYVLTSANTNNKIHGTADVYKKK